MNVRTWMAGCRLTALIAVSTLGACVTAEPQFVTIDGPETPAIRDGVTGHVSALISRRQCALTSAIAAGSPPACVSLRPDPDPAPPDLSNALIATVLPESAGSMLMLEYRRSTREIEGARGADRGTDRFAPGTIALTRVRCHARACDAARERLATWPSAYLNDVYRKTLALSPDGRRVAVLPDSALLKFDGYSPRLPSGLRFRPDLKAGDVHVVDLETGDDRRVQTQVLDGQPISWSADGRRLLLIRLETADALPARLAAELRGNERPKGTGLPVVETIDVASGATEMLALGMHAVWSPDQRTLLFESSIDHVELRDLATGSNRPLLLPGYAGRSPWIRFVAPRRVAYRALPTRGTPDGFTGHNSPLIGPKQLVALKVADIDTLEFATVLPDLDPRDDLEFDARY